MKSLTENWEQIKELYANDTPFAYSQETGIVVKTQDDEAKEGDE